MGLAQKSNYLIDTFSKYFNSIHVFIKQRAIRYKKQYSSKQTKKKYLLNE